ncbi:MAG TPA: hypothetical protein VMD91_03765 [Candidatus Sulfotelmatobacter sp.]|nr:hypothetical protein [Candidatus Sulfotelmatobacter sp.]
MLTGIIRSARSNIGKIVVTAGAVATVGVGAMLPRPASANTTDTAITAAAILGGIALIAGATSQPSYPVCGYYDEPCPAYGGPVYGPGWRAPRTIYVPQRGGYRGSYDGGRRDENGRGRR